MSLWRVPSKEQLNVNVNIKWTESVNLYEIKTLWKPLQTILDAHSLWKSVKQGEGPLPPPAGDCGTLQACRLQVRPTGTQVSRLWTANQLSTSSWHLLGWYQVTVGLSVTAPLWIDQAVHKQEPNKTLGRLQGGMKTRVAEVEESHDTKQQQYRFDFLFCGNMLQLYYRFLNAQRENKNSLRQQKLAVTGQQHNLDRNRPDWILIG